MKYDEFIKRKLSTVPPTGLTTIPALSESLFPHQRDLVSWSLRRGRSAIFASTGLGKSRMWIEWARHVPGPVIALTPLAVAQQSRDEAVSLGVGDMVRVCRSQDDVGDAKIAITNYDRLHLFDASKYNGVVLDESSIIKHHSSHTLKMLLDAFASTPFKLCTTATPAPNDWTELGTHAEFLGICTRVEMLSEYFVHDGGDTSAWRLKGHARDAFWKWVSSWAALVRMPSDLGHDDTGYVLPPLHTHHHVIATDRIVNRDMGQLFVDDARSLLERRSARKATVNARVSQCAALVNDSVDPWIVWCDLNAESEALTKSISGAVEVRGSMTADEKEYALAGFARGDFRVIVTKPSISGFGLNWQHCAHQAFVGVTDSWESYYQAVRRSWRFGQKRAVNVHVFSSDIEGNVVANVARKEADAQAMSDALAAETRGYVIESVKSAVRETNAYKASKKMVIPSWIQGEEQ